MDRDGGPPPGEKVRIFLGRYLFSCLPGLTGGDWLRLLSENRFRIDPLYWPRAAMITAGSLPNSACRFWEERRYGKRVDGMEIPPPLFILGHWRSGTTHLHNLLALDPGFAYPNVYQVFFPHTFLSTERINSRLYRGLLARTRLIDNVKLTFKVPYEDEFALCTSTSLSPYLTWVFSRRWDHYDRYLTLREVPVEEVEAWKSALIRFLKKLTLKHGRPLILKSPTHTCRIKLLLELFPEARFVHIHREPYTVFQSTRRMLDVAAPLMCLQRFSVPDLDERIIERYRRMYELFFEERPLIPEERFHEVSYEELERDPRGAMRGLYEKLALPGFGALELALERYLGGLKSYRKNEHAPLPPPLRERIASRWQRTFEEWGYER